MDENCENCKYYTELRKLLGFCKLHKIPVYWFENCYYVLKKEIK